MPFFLLLASRSACQWYGIAGAKMQETIGLGERHSTRCHGCTGMMKAENRTAVIDQRTRAFAREYDSTMEKDWIL
jgi:hypothetical protein